MPHIADLVQSYGSKAADEKGSDNLRGVKNRAVDALLAAMAQAKTLDARTTAELD